MTAPTPAPASLLETIETQRLGCELAGSPLYAEVLDAVGRDVVAGGVCRRLLIPYVHAPFGDAVLLRLLGAVHHLVLDGRAPDLAAHYPSAGGEPGRGLGASFVEVAARHEADLVPMLEWGVQTNEVGRAAALLCGHLALAGLGKPLRLLEVGASAGLNLWFDRYRFEAGGAGFGPVDGRLRFVEPFLGPPPDLGAPVRVASRRGCDLEPIDPTTEAGRLRLRSYLWPDQPERRARLDAALAVVADCPAVVDRADGGDWLADQLAVPAPGVVTVVVHSIMFQYLPPAGRRRFVGLVEQAGRRATDGAPVAWLRMEPGGDQAETRLTVWPGGATRLIARSAYHGPPVVLAGPVGAGFGIGSGGAATRAVGGAGARSGR